MAQVDNSKSYRAWCWTLFVKANDDGTYDHPVIDTDHVKYYVYQGEWTKDNRFHWQGYIEMKNPARFSTMCKLIPKAYMKQRIKSADQARAYCMKEESRCVEPTEWGNFSGEAQGTRTDLTDAKIHLASGEWTKIEMSTFVRCNKGLMAYAQLMGYRRKDEIKRNWKTEIIVIYDESGKGKSKIASEMCNNDYYQVSCGNYKNVWWTGYQGHEDVIISDYHGQIDFDTFLSIIDRYPCCVPIHGGQVQLLAKRIIITSTAHPREWYSDEKYRKRYRELERRINKIVTVEDVEKEQEAQAMIEELYKPNT